MLSLGEKRHKCMVTFVGAVGAVECGILCGVINCVVNDVVDNAVSMAVGVAVGSDLGNSVDAVVCTSKVGSWVGGNVVIVDCWVGIGVMVAEVEVVLSPL